MLIKENVARPELHVMKVKEIVKMILNVVEVWFVEITIVNNLEISFIRKMTVVQNHHLPSFQNQDVKEEMLTKENAAQPEINVMKEKEIVKIILNVGEV